MNRFFVPGVPKPKGSTKSFYNPKAKRVITMNACKDGQGWQSLVSWTAKESGVEYNDKDPISLVMTFGVPRPKAHFNKKGLRVDAPPYPVTRTGDLDKLQRAILDALTGIAYADDSQVCDIYSTKEFTATPGVLIAIDAL